MADETVLRVRDVPFDEVRRIHPKIYEEDFDKDARAGWEQSRGALIRVKLPPIPTKCSAGGTIWDLVEQPWPHITACICEHEAECD